MKIGLCTGGGDCPGLNAAIRSVVKHALGICQFEVVGIEGSLTGLWQDPPTAKPMAMSDVSKILNRGGTVLGTNNKGSPFRDPEQRDKFVDAIKANWRKLGLDAVIVIGGDGTQTMAKVLHEEGLKIVGIPKTIDNDLPGIENTIGFSTAVDVAAEAAGRLETSADAHDRIMVLEVMGRDAGHIALHAGIAGGANIILLPEIPFSFDSIVNKIRDRQQFGRNSSLVVIAEGAHPIAGEQVFRASSSGSKVLGGIASRFAVELHQRTNIETRVTVLGYIQRGGSPNVRDRILASSLGQYAVHLLASGQHGCIVHSNGGRLSSTPYEKIPSGRRTISDDDPLLQTAEGIGICLGRDADFAIETKG